MSASSVQWSVIGDGDRAMPYSDENSDAIEAHYTQRNQNNNSSGLPATLLVRVRTPNGTFGYVVDVVNMTQLNPKYGTVRRIQRRAVLQLRPISASVRQQLSADCDDPFKDAPLHSLDLRKRNSPLSMLRAMAAASNDPNNRYAKPPGCEWLFHETNEQAAGAILGDEGSMARGSGGAAGGGIYFAQTPALARQKAQNHGVMLKCLVYLGNIREINTQDDAVRGLTFAELRKQGFDAARLTFMNGDEYVVYNRDQVLVRERC